MDSATPDPNDYLMVDTQFFPPEFKSRLLSFIPDFDAQCDGLLIHSENFQALNLLQERYREQVKCIYIDPPYNTGNDGFIYRDNYQHSSWLSMMEDRLSVSRELMNDEAAIFTSIDDNEVDNLKKLCDRTFISSNFVAIINWKGRGGRQDSRYYAAVHEYILCFAKQKDLFIAGEDIKSGDVYPKYDEEKRRHYKTQLLRKWGSNSRREDRPNLYYPITAPDGSQVYPVVSVRDNQRPSNFVKFEGRWRHGASTMRKNIEEGLVEFIRQEDGSWIPYEKIYAPLEGEEKTKKYTTWIDDTNTGATEIKVLFRDSVFDYPKTNLLVIHFLKMANAEPNDLILDYFAGSGTTAHAVINLNREDGGNRKYILVEMGDHFNTVLKPRIEKVVYSPDWKDGKPTSFDKGVSHCFKYIRLESYEDTLNNLELPESDPIASNPKMQPALREDYMLHYLLDTEANASLLDIDMFKNPFGGYRLKIKRPGSEACDETPVDLIETFNYLIGLRVSQYYLPRRYSVRFKRAVDPELPGEEGSRRLVLDGRPKLDDAGKWSFLRLEGVVPAHPLNPNNGQTKRVLVIWRNLTGDMEQDNAVLDWFADDLRLNDKVPEYDIVYVNGCNNLGADRKETDSYQVRLIEEEFFRKMWG